MPDPRRGFYLGAGSQDVYDGSALASRGVVVVTINYRMGAFGFVRLKELTNGEIPSTGNEGILDQAAALAWVRDNIAAFGGDPGNVTIFGESAGSMSVVSLLSMPAARGLFHKAIAQSGPGHSHFSVDEALDYITKPMLEAFGTSDPDALRAASTEEMAAAVPAFMEAAASPDPAIRNRWAKPRDRRERPIHGLAGADLGSRRPCGAAPDGRAPTRDEMSSAVIAALATATSCGGAGAGSRSRCQCARRGLIGRRGATPGPRGLGSL